MAISLWSSVWQQWSMVVQWELQLGLLQLEVLPLPLWRWRVKVSMGGGRDYADFFRFSLPFCGPTFHSSILLHTNDDWGWNENWETSFFLVRAPEVDICPRQCPGWRQLWDTLLVWPPRPPWLPQSLQALPRPHSWFHWTAVRMLWLWSQLWGLEAVLKSAVCEEPWLLAAAAAATSFVMSAARPATVTGIAQRLWEGRENGGESLTIVCWQSCPISTFGRHLTLRWVDGCSLDSWSSWARSTVSSVGSTHSQWHSLKPPSPVHFLCLAEAVFLRFGWRSGDSCFSTCFTRPCPQLLVGRA